MDPNSSSSSAVASDTVTRATDLEREIAMLTQRLQQTAALVDSAQQAARRCNSARSEARVRIPVSGHSLRQVRGQLENTKTLLAEEFALQERHRKDNAGLRRSLAGLQRRLQGLNETLRLREEDAATARMKERDTVVKCSTLEQSISSMAGLHRSLELQVEREHDKRLRLKAAARAKVERVGQAEQTLRQQLSDFDEEMDGWRRRVQEQEERTAEATRALEEARAEATDAERRCRELSAAREDLHQQVLFAEREHCKLQKQLASTLERIDHLNQTDMERQRSFRTNYLEHLDSTIERRRCLQRLDRDVDISAQVAQTA